MVNLFLNIFNSLIEGIMHKCMHFCIVVVINGEKAAFNTPTFAQKRERTLDMLIKDLCSEHMGDTSKSGSHMVFVLSCTTKQLFSDIYNVIF